MDYDDNIEWENALDNAKEALGYGEKEYIEDWDAVVELAKDLMSEDSKREHKIYLQSDIWKKIRLEILQRDNNLCQDCKHLATEVHHLNYIYIKQDKEKDFCISLCRKCHQNRHNFKFNEVKNMARQIVCPYCAWWLRRVCRQDDLFECSNPKCQTTIQHSDKPRSIVESKKTGQISDFVTYDQSKITEKVEDDEELYD
jgi:hypothetical protein